jgi:hypothetical protein
VLEDNSLTDIKCGVSASSNEVELAFKECLKSLLRFARERNLISLSYEIAPIIDLSKRVWQLGLAPRYIYSKPVLLEVIEGRIKLPEVEKCVELMLREDFPRRISMKIVDKDGRPVERPNYRPFLIGEILLPLMFKHVEKCGLEYNEECFKSIYEELVEYVYSSKATYIIVAPLENFELHNAEEVVMGEYKIRRLEEKEIETLLHMGGAHALGASFLYTGFLENIYCIERRVNVPKEESFNVSTYFEGVENLITALRLFKHGNVGCSMYLYYPKRITYSVYGVYGASGPLSRATRAFSKYVLDASDIEHFKLFWRVFERAINLLPNNIKFSLKWFNKSYLEPNDVDRLLDLAIALESLFQTGERLDLYVVRFIGKDLEERKKIYKDVYELRRVRGAIVHEGYYEVDREFVDRIENYYRQSARKFIELLSEGKTRHEDIIKSIKESLLS